MSLVKTIKKMFSALLDLLILIFPFSLKQKPGFGFLVHARNLADLQRQFPAFKFFPDKVVAIIARNLWPVTISRVTGLKSGNKEVPGWVIAIPMTAGQMMADRELALKKIILAAKLAKKRGIRMIGLGALTSSLSKGGLDLIDKVDLNITTGHAYTAHSVTSYVFDLADFMNLDTQSTVVAIVGAAGSVGSSSAKLIARRGFSKLILIDLERKLESVEKLAEEIKKLNLVAEVRVTNEIKHCREADMIVTATNTPEALLRTEHLKSGAIVIDDAQPSDISLEVLDRADVLVVEAGVVHTPNINSNFNFGLKNRHDNFCCMAEVMILAAKEWDKHYVINRPTLEMIDNVINWGEELGFQRGEYQNFKEKISVEKLNYVKKIIAKAHES